MRHTTQQDSRTHEDVALRFSMTPWRALPGADVVTTANDFGLHHGLHAVKRNLGVHGEAAGALPKESLEARFEDDVLVGACLPSH